MPDIKVKSEYRANSQDLNTGQAYKSDPLYKEKLSLTDFFCFYECEPVKTGLVEETMDELLNATNKLITKMTKAFSRESAWRVINMTE